MISSEVIHDTEESINRFVFTYALTPEEYHRAVELWNKRAPQSTFKSNVFASQFLEPIIDARLKPFHAGERPIKLKINPVTKTILALYSAKNGLCAAEATELPDGSLEIRDVEFDDHDKPS